MTKYLRSGVDPNVYSLTSGFMLPVAVAANQPGMVNLLLGYGADPSYVHFEYRSAPYEDLMCRTDLALLRAFSDGAKVSGFAYYITPRAS